jgi:hypothetical protein
MRRSITGFIAAILLTMLAGCASTKLTVDDGRQLDGELVREMQAYGEAAAVIRPAIVRTAALTDIDSSCSTQYELPFEVLTSYGLDSDDAKVAWVRALGVDENLTVIAADPSSGLEAGEIVAGVAGYKSRNTLKMAGVLLEARDRGEPFWLELASGEQVAIYPIKTCRGHVLIASPFEPGAQLYHWAQAVHPLEIFHETLTRDEAAWIVLWTQGLSERGGARMKTYAFMVGSMKWVATLGLGFATSGAAASLRGGAAAGASSAGEVAAVQLAGQAGSMMARAAANRASLSGISRVAAGVFDRADKWAFENMKKLGMDPRAGLSLYKKLLAHGAAENAFFFDEKRLSRMHALIAGLPHKARADSTAAAESQARH